MNKPSENICKTLRRFSVDVRHSNHLTNAATILHLQPASEGCFWIVWQSLSVSGLSRLQLVCLASSFIADQLALTLMPDHFSLSWSLCCVHASISLPGCLFVSVSRLSERCLRRQWRPWTLTMWRLRKLEVSRTWKDAWLVQQLISSSSAWRHAMRR